MPGEHIELQHQIISLKKRLDEVETILDEFPDGVIVVDFDRKIIYLNHLARAVFNLSDSELLGKPAGEVFEVEELVEIIQGDWRNTPERIELALDDGRVFTVQLRPIPEVGLALALQDITYLKKLDRIKSEFIRTVSHDLRSPLTAILGYADLIKRIDPVTPRQEEFIRRIQLGVQNITTLISDLLELGRIEEEFDLQKEPVSIYDTIYQSAERLQRRAAEKEQVLNLDISGEVTAVFGNPHRLQLMVDNLVSNAIKFSPRGEMINLRAWSEGEQVILQIKDRGIGIPKNDQGRIFDKFFRASNVPADTPGSGLGLTIVKSIVNNHNGRIWVASAPGEGSIFTVVLPVGREGLRGA